MSEQWVRVAAAGDIAEGEILAVEVNGEPVALYRLDGGEIRATHNICTHEFACLSDGWLEGDVVECPLHGGQFNVRTGEGLGPPIESPLAVYPTRVDGDDIFIDAGAVGAKAR